jgi:transcriptional regulator with XRE-family HTH domain
MAMPELDAVTRRLIDEVGATVKQARLARHWSQRRLARASGLDHSVIGRIERGQMPQLSFRTAGRVLQALAVEPHLRLIAPRIAEPAIRDRAHARCVGMVARRLERAGFAVVTEAEVGTGRWRGFIDVVAMHPAQRLLLAIEVKTELRDIGEVDRQLGTYVEAVWAVATANAWRPRGVTGILLLLATTETDRRLQEHRAYVDRAFQLRARNLADIADGSSRSLPARGVRGLAMVDPGSRRRQWLMPTAMDGRRTAAPYTDRGAFLAGVRRSPARDPRGVAMRAAYNHGVSTKSSRRARIS